MSELEKLLEKNAYGEGLSDTEKKRAYVLIFRPDEFQGVCWLCGAPAIYDTGLCSAHAHYALVTRK